MTLTSLSVSALTWASDVKILSHFYVMVKTLSDELSCKRTGLGMSFFFNGKQPFCNFLFAFLGSVV